MLKISILLVVIGLSGCTHAQQQAFQEHREENTCIQQMERYGSSWGGSDAKEKCRRIAVANKIVEKEPQLRQYYDQKAKVSQEKARALRDEMLYGKQ